MSIFYLIIIGAIAGFIATRVMNVQFGVLPTIAIGIVGALVGGSILRLVLSAVGAVGGIIGAILGAMLLIWLIQTYGKRR